MNLQRLTARFDNIFEPSFIALTLRMPSFTTITHLDTLGTPSYWVVPGLPLLPALTHVCLFHMKSSDLNYALLNCKKLQVLINVAYIFRDRLTLRLLGAMYQELSINDPRLVLAEMPSSDARVKDWQVGTQGGLDLWARADLFVDKKRRGEIQPGLLRSPPCVDLC